MKLKWVMASNLVIRNLARPGFSHHRWYLAYTYNECDLGILLINQP